MKLEYACRVLAQLAKTYPEGRVRRIEELGTLEAISPNYLTQILSELRHAGLVESKRGKDGGYLLASPPEKISLLDIVEAIEGPLLEFAGEATGQSGARAQATWEKVFGSLSENLRGIPLTELIKEEAEAMWHI
ncbi:MAG: Rrf2 family transcriptional regulator [Verrucomicrobiota bacterium]